MRAGALSDSVCVCVCVRVCGLCNCGGDDNMCCILRDHTKWLGNERYVFCDVCEYVCVYAFGGGATIHTVIWYCNMTKRARAHLCVCVCVCLKI